MKRIFLTSLILGVMLLAVPSCSKSDLGADQPDQNSSTSDDSGSGSNPADTTSKESGTVTTTTATISDLANFTIDLNTASLTETETIPSADSDAEYDDYVEHSDFTSVVNIAYSGTSATVTNAVSGVTISQSGGDVTVTSTAKGVKYVLSGTTTDGSFKVYSDNKFEVRLAGVSIANSDGAAINSQSSKRMFVVVDSGTVNSLSDGSSYTTATGEDQKGTIFSEGQIIFSGAGTINVTAKAKNGIVSDDYLMFRPGNVINVTASVSNGLKANDYITVSGGVLNISTSGTAAKGISCDGAVHFRGGRTTIITTGGGTYDSTERDATSCAGIKADSTFTMTGGELYIKSTGLGGKGISGDQTINISGGTLKVITSGKQYAYTTSITSLSKGIKADGNLTISGGTIWVRATGGEGSEGIESKYLLTFNGGTTLISSYDDGVNAKQISFQGGYLFSQASNNDALDANGTMKFSGGLAICCGASTPEGGFDCDQNTFAITGGTLIGLGGDNSAPSSSDCTQCVVTYGGSITANTMISVYDSDGNGIFSFKAPKASSETLISSPSFKKGSTYTVKTGATASGGTSFCNYSADASLSGGSDLFSTTFSSYVMTAGTSTGGGGGGMPGGGGGMPGGGGH